LSRVEDGAVVAADGYTLLFSWRRGQSAMRDDIAESVGPEEAMAGESPPGETANGGPETIGEAPTSVPPGEPAPEPPPLVTAPEPPAPGPQAVVPLRLDAAAPSQVTVGVPFDLAAAVRRAASPLLAADDLTQVESAGFAAYWPEGVAFLSLRIQIAAPDCDIHGGDTRPVRLLAGQDGPTVYFQLTPRRAGPLSVIVTVYQETDWIGSTRLRTEAGGTAASATPSGAAPLVAAAADAAPRAGLVMTVASRPLGDAEVNLKLLRDALDNGYSDAELRDLCFELEVDYEDLPGEGQSAKARELVLFCKRRGLLATLVQYVMRDRPMLITN
jgi:hypothetical protein